MIQNFFYRLYSTKMPVLAFFGVLFFLFGLCPVQNAQSPVRLDKGSNYRIGIGDVLKVIVLKQDILSQDELRVGNEGTIRMPMLEAPIPAACLTESELSSEITERYKKYLLNPQVYVSVKEFNANPVAVGGAVVSPGIFQLKRPMRLLEILAFVNGPSLNAGQTIDIIRSGNGSKCGQKPADQTESSAPDEADGQEIVSLSLAEVMKGNENFNPYLQGGDIIRIPEAELKQAFVLGNVKSAVTINLKEPVTLSRAIAMAGGVSSGAKIDRIKVSRQNPDSLAKTEIIVNLKDINKSSQEDFLLQPNDIVDVPGPSKFRKSLEGILKSIIPAVTRVPVVIP